MRTVITLFFAALCFLTSRLNGYQIDLGQWRSGKKFRTVTIPRSRRWLFHFSWFMGDKVCRESVIIEIAGLICSAILIVQAILVGLFPDNLFFRKSALFVLIVYGCTTFVCALIVVCGSAKNRQKPTSYEKRCISCEIENHFKPYGLGPIREVTVLGDTSVKDSETYYAILQGRFLSQRYWAKLSPKYKYQPKKDDHAVAWYSSLERCFFLLSDDQEKAYKL